MGGTLVCYDSGRRYRRMSSAEDATTAAAAPLAPRRRVRRFVERLARAFAVTVVVLLGLGWTLPPVVGAYLTLHPTRPPLRADVAQLPFPVEPVAFPAADGVVLRGWFVRAAADAPVILLGH